MTIRITSAKIRAVFVLIHSFLPSRIRCFVFFRVPMYNIMCADFLGLLVYKITELFVINCVLFFHRCVGRPRGLIR